MVSCLASKLSLATCVIIQIIQLVNRRFALQYTSNRTQFMNILAFRAGDAVCEPVIPASTGRTAGAGDLAV